MKQETKALVLEIDDIREVSEVEGLNEFTEVATVIEQHLDKSYKAGYKKGYEDRDKLCLVNYRCDC